MAERVERRPLRARLAALSPARVSEAPASAAALGFGLGAALRRRERERALLLLGVLGLGLLIVGGTALALAAPQSPLLLPRSRTLVPSMLGPFAGSDLALGSAGVTTLVLAMLAGYLAVVRSARVLPAGAALAVVGLLNAAFALAPPLMSADVFSYIAYGRMGVLHGISPYLHGPGSIMGDAVFSFTGHAWVHTPSVYGPVFTLVSYAIAPLGLAASVWTFKLLAVAASLSCVALVWSCARLRESDPLPAALVVGLNPLLLIWAVGGGHNDLLMVAVLLAGIRLVLARRPGVGSGTVVVAAAMKLSAGIALPFLLLGLRAERRRRAITGIALAAVALLIVTVAVFGGAPFDVGRTLGDNPGDWHSLPGVVVTKLLAAGRPSHAVRLGLELTTAAICAGLAWRVWRRSMDWIAGAGWGTFAMLALSPVLLPWYVVWLLPFGALGGRRLRVVAVGVTVAVVALRIGDFMPAEAARLGALGPGS